MSIETVGVLGCGLMGSGIAQACAAAGYWTIVREVSDAAVQKGIDSIRAFLDNGVAKGKVTSEARDATIGNLSGRYRALVRPWSRPRWRPNRRVTFGFAARTLSRSSRRPR